MTGATITSEAALRTIDRAARAGARAGLGIEVAPAAGEAGGSPITARLVFALVALALFVPVFLRGGDRLRLAYQLVALVGFGLVFNCLLTEIDLANLSLGRLPSLGSNPCFYLLVGFVAVTTLLWGQVYCGYVCPFGALQELVSRLGRRLGLRGYAHQGLEVRVRFARFALAAAAFSAVWWTGDPTWVSFDPMQRLFELDLGGWLAWLTAAALVGALFYYRFWCRYVCPAGAVLALGNKLSLLGVPRRDLGRCDLAVRSPFDLGCLRCHRCADGADIGVRRPPRGYSV
jgi:polyferredoxin